jgi:hypothetical protein
MKAGLLGAMATPAQGNKLDGLPVIALDNGCGPGVRGIAAGYPGDAKYLAWLTSLRHLAARITFAVVPDVVGDADDTLARFAELGPRVRALGYPLALAAQDGLTAAAVPWPDVDVLFIGGSTEWKLGPVPPQLIAAAQARGVPSHFARVNTLRRARYAAWLGCDSADGTCITIAPDKNLPLMLRFLATVNGQGELWAPA